jgi:hypothetical protein
MMRAVARITAPLGIKTMVSLNSIMVDGTGMCGGCRVLLGNKSKFACVDGPEFDASLVNFEVLMQRNTMYRDKECQSLKHFEEHKEEEVAELRAELAAGKGVAIARSWPPRNWPERTHLCLREAAAPLRHECSSAQRAHEDHLRRHMPELDPGVRSRNFEEVNLGLRSRRCASLRPRAASNAPSPAASSIARWASRSRKSWP